MRYGRNHPGDFPRRYRVAWWGDGRTLSNIPEPADPELSLGPTVGAEIHAAVEFIPSDRVQDAEQGPPSEGPIAGLLLKLSIAILQILGALEGVIFMMLTVGRIWRPGDPLKADAGLPTDLVGMILWPALVLVALFATAWPVHKLRAMIPEVRPVPTWGPKAPLWDREVDELPA